VHTVQRIYGCEWDDQTGATNAFKQYGYDGEDFVSLDWKELRYISPVPQGIQTVQSWNNDRVSPLVSLLQKSPSSPVTSCNMFLPQWNNNLLESPGKRMNNSIMRMWRLVNSFPMRMEPFRRPSKLHLMNGRRTSTLCGETPGQNQNSK
ncbi:hypothetical protein QQF64_013098, partial [Cirrhinus molitorella]